MPHHVADGADPSCPAISTDVRLCLAVNAVATIKVGSVTVDDLGGMRYLHICSFCGWERERATPVMLAPACPDCGCALDARAVGAGEGAGGVALALPLAALAALRRAGIALSLLMLYAAAKLGYSAAGPSGAMVAFGVGGFLLLPFVPQRLR
jgi:hypothetical protein